MKWRYPEDKSKYTPQKFRNTLISCCDKKRFPMVRLAGLEDENSDLLLYALTGILPDIKPLDFGVGSKGELTTTAKEQYEERNKRNMSRSAVSVKSSTTSQ